MYIINTQASKRAEKVSHQNPDFNNVNKIKFLPAASNSSLN